MNCKIRLYISIRGARDLHLNCYRLVDGNSDPKLEKVWTAKKSPFWNGETRKIEIGGNVSISLESGFEIEIQIERVVFSSRLEKYANSPQYINVLARIVRVCRDKVPHDELVPGTIAEILVSHGGFACPSG